MLQEYGRCARMERQAGWLARTLAKKPPAIARGCACPFSSGTKVTTVLRRFIKLDGDGPSLGIELARKGSLDAFQGFAVRHPGIGDGFDLDEAVGCSLEDAKLARSVFGS